MLSNLYLRQFIIGEDFEEEYLRNVPAVRYVPEFTFSKPVTFFVGENGSGKSTLVEALAVACGFNPEGGTKNFNFSTEATHSTLYKNITAVKGVRFPKDGFFLRAESFYNASTEVERVARRGLSGDSPAAVEAFYKRNYGGKSLHHQSHGESFMALVLNRFKGNSLFFLDEPEAALSPTRQMTLLTRIHDLVQQGAQFIIATHSPILMALPNADILQIDEKGASIVPYMQTKHYQITKRFLDAPESVLRHLIPTAE